MTTPISAIKIDLILAQVRDTTNKQREKVTRQNILYYTIQQEKDYLSFGYNLINSFLISFSC